MKEGEVLEIIAKTRSEIEKAGLAIMFNLRMNFF